MIREAALITVSCVLFVQMGLSDAVQETLRFRSRIASCPKCCAFWCNLGYFLLTGHGVVASVAASFICSYCAMWLAMAYDAVAVLYNRIYESISKEAGATEDADTEQPSASGDSDAMPEM